MNKLLREKREAAFSEGIESHRANSITLDINEKPRRFYRNLNLYLIPTLACNASCEDCVGKYSSDLSPQNIPEQLYINRLKAVLSMLAQLNPSVSIVGGEPSLDRKLPAILKILKEKSTRKPILDTNGTGLLDYSLIEPINQSSLEHINISRRHYNENTNQKLMGLRPKITNSQLEGIVRNIDPKIKIRLQTCLDTQGISDYKECKEYIFWATQLAAAVAIAEPAILPKEDLYLLRIVNYSDTHRVELKEILSQIDKDPQFSLIKQILGPNYYEEVYEFNGIPVTFKSADYSKKSGLERDFIDYLVLHPNGTLTSSWNHKNGILVPKINP